MPKNIPDAQILDATIAVVMDRGLHEVTTRRIATVAGINEVTLFRRFGSKTALLRQALFREVEAFCADVAITVSDDLTADLTRLVNQHAAFLARRGDLVTSLLSDLLREPAWHAFFAKLHPLYTSLEAILQHYQQRGELHPEPPWSQLMCLLGPIWGGALLAKVRDEAAGTPEEDAEEHVRRFLHAHASHPQRR